MASDLELRSFQRCGEMWPHLIHARLPVTDTLGCVWVWDPRHWHPGVRVGLGLWPGSVRLQPIRRLPPPADLMILKYWKRIKDNKVCLILRSLCVSVCVHVSACVVLCMLLFIHLFVCFFISLDPLNTLKLLTAQGIKVSGTKAVLFLFLSSCSCILLLFPFVPLSFSFLLCVCVSCCVCAKSSVTLYSVLAPHF